MAVMLCPLPRLAEYDAAAEPEFSECRLPVELEYVDGVKPEVQPDTPPVPWGVEVPEPAADTLVTSGFHTVIHHLG